MNIRDLPFPILSNEELRKLSDKELDIYKLEMQANIIWIYDNINDLLVSNHYMKKVK